MRRRTVDERPRRRVHLPQIIADLMEVAGADATWALVGEKGGQTIFVPAEVNQAHWLAHLVGLDAARKIAKHYRAGNSGGSLTIPLARLYHSKVAMVKAIEGGASANQAAAASGMHVRSVFRTKAKLSLTVEDINDDATDDVSPVQLRLI